MEGQGPAEEHGLSNQSNTPFVEIYIDELHRLRLGFGNDNDLQARYFALIEVLRAFGNPPRPGSETWVSEDKVPSNFL